MKADTKQKLAEYNRTFRSPNFEQNSTVRTARAFETVMKTLGVHVSEFYAQGAGSESSVTIPLTELASVVHPDHPYHIFVKFSNIGGGSTLEGRNLGVVVNQIRNKQASSSPDRLFDFTEWTPEQTWAALITNDSKLLAAMNEKMVGMAETILDAEAAAIVG